MSIKDERLFIRHMLDAARQAREYAVGRSRADLEHDPLLRDGFVRQLTIIGEAAGRVTGATRNTYPGVPWPDLVGMRNRIVHEYFRVDLDIVWATVEFDLPELVSQLEELIESGSS